MDREQDIPFVYEDGVLKPEGPVDLPKGARGVARIREMTEDAAAKHAWAVKAAREIAASGVFRSGGRKLTRDEMHERD